MRTKHGDDDVILDDLQRPRDDKAERVEALSLVEHDITRSNVGDGQAHGQCPQAAVVGAAERRVLVEHDPVQVNADVCSRARRTVAQYLGNIWHNIELE